MTDQHPPRTAVVTGAASGIGLAVAERFVSDGIAVALLDLDGGAATAVADRLSSGGRRAAGFAVDVSSRLQVERAVAAAADTLGAPTIVVNSAGLDGFDRFVDIDDATWDRVIAVNLTGTFYCCQAVVPSMLEARWGRIVNISSSTGQTGNPLMTHYAAAKAGVIGFTKALSHELAPKGITVNNIPPGFVDTPMLRRTEERGLLGEGIAHHERTTPVRRVGRPEDIAAACAFLVRDEASYITGQTLAVNGGRVTT